MALFFTEPRWSVLLFSSFLLVLRDRFVSFIPMYNLKYASIFPLIPRNRSEEGGPLLCTFSLHESNLRLQSRSFAFPYGRWYLHDALTFRALLGRDRNPRSWDRRTPTFRSVQNHEPYRIIFVIFFTQAHRHTPIAHSTWSVSQSHSLPWDPSDLCSAYRWCWHP